MSQTKVAVGMLNATGTPGSGNFLRGDGSWTAAGGMTFINTTDISAAATYNFTAVNASSYDGYGLFLQNVVPVTDNVQMFFRTSTDGGSSYDAGSSDYSWMAENLGTYQYDPADNQIELVGDAGSTSYTIGSDTNEPGVSGWIWVYGPHLTQHTMIRWSIAQVPANQPTFGVDAMGGAGVRMSAADVDAFQILFSSGNIESGTINVYGLANA